jgi:hypothetical protein
MSRPSPQITASARIGAADSSAVRTAPDADESPGGQLEILGEAATEQQARVEVSGIGEADRVPGAVGALVVEGGLGEIGTLMVAGANRYAADADLIGAVTAGHQLTLTPGSGTPMQRESS